MPELVIVGAGFAGLGLGIRLKRAGFDDFVILERAGDVGGTWRDNVYPGVACDIPSHLYSYSFRPKPDWSRVFAPGAEIQDYLREAAREEGLLRHIRFDDELVKAAWVESEGNWTVHSTGGSITARVLVMAVGRLSEPQVPGIPGLDAFPGRAFHSARWQDESLEALRVGVVGTGASAVQLVPELAGRAGRLVVFQRHPAWVLPRQDHAFTPAEQAAFARGSSGASRHRGLDTGPRRGLDSPGYRQALFDEAEALFPARIAGSPQIAALRERAEAHLASSVADPALRAALTPDYEIGCKRAVFSDDYFPALQRPGVVLEPSALAAVDGSTAVAESGARYDLDALVLATGFETTRPPFATRVTGRHGTLAGHWAHGMTSHASTVVTGFPNLFVLDGPNAGLGHNSSIEVIEAQLDYVLGALDWLGGHPDSVLDVTPEAEAAYTALLDEAAERTVWVQGECASWYTDHGRLTLLWPGTAAEFRERNAGFDASVFAQQRLRVAAGGDVVEVLD